MIQKVIAERYAKGVLKAVETLEKAGIVKADLETIKETIEGHKELKAIYLDPTIDVAKKYSIVDELFANLSKESVNLLKTVISNHKQGVVGEIIDALDEIIHASDNKQLGKLTVVKPLSPSQKEKIEKIVSAKLDKKVVLKEFVDSEILGGFKVEVGSFLIDATIKKQLDNLKKLSI